MTSWTQDPLVRQASLKEVRERTDKTLRPDWINLPDAYTNELRRLDLTCLSRVLVV
jgi:hypothetical protein